MGLCVNWCEMDCMGCIRVDFGNIFFVGKDFKDYEKENLRRIREI